LDEEQMPFVRDALQRVDAAVTEVRPGADDEILHCARDDPLARSRKGHDPRRDGNSDPAERAVTQLNLAAVQACPDLEADAREPIAARPRRADAACRAVERRLHAVAGRLPDFPAVALDLGARDVVVTREQRAPFAVAE